MRGERLTDLSLIPRLYEEYNRIAEENGFRGDLRNGNHKQFLMVLSPPLLPGVRVRRQDIPLVPQCRLFRSSSQIQPYRLQYARQVRGMVPELQDVCR